MLALLEAEQNAPPPLRNQSVFNQSRGLRGFAQRHQDVRTAFTVMARLAITLDVRG